jgi:phage shock protein A
MIRRGVTTRVIACFVVALIAPFLSGCGGSSSKELAALIRRNKELEGRLERLNEDVRVLEERAEALSNEVGANESREGPVERVEDRCAESLRECVARVRELMQDNERLKAELGQLRNDRDSGGPQ